MCSKNTHHNNLLMEAIKLDVDYSASFRLYIFKRDVIERKRNARNFTSNNNKLYVLAT